MQAKTHVKVVGIDWFEDDMGITVCSQNGDIQFYELSYMRNTPNPV